MRLSAPLAVLVVVFAAVALFLLFTQVGHAAVTPNAGSLIIC